MRYLILLCLLLSGYANATDVLIVGDSVTMGDGHVGNKGYTPYVQAKMGNVFHNGSCSLLTDVYSDGTNSGNSARLVACLPAWLASMPSGTIVHFNAGLHDIHIANCLIGETSHQVELSDYLMNLQIALNLIWAAGDIPVFATTTPVENRIMCISNDDIIKYNHAAKLMMDSQGVAVDDLYTVMRPVQDKYHIPGNIHFTNAGSDFLSIQVVASLKEILGKKF